MSICVRTYKIGTNSIKFWNFHKKKSMIGFSIDFNFIEKKTKNLFDDGWDSDCEFSLPKKSRFKKKWKNKDLTICGCYRTKMKSKVRFSIFDKLGCFDFDNCVQTMHKDMVGCWSPHFTCGYYTTGCYTLFCKLDDIDVNVKILKSSKDIDFVQSRLLCEKWELPKDFMSRSSRHYYKESEDDDDDDDGSEFRPKYEDVEYMVYEYVPMSRNAAEIKRRMLRELQKELFCLGDKIK